VVGVVGDEVDEIVESLASRKALPIADNNELLSMLERAVEIAQLNTAHADRVTEHLQQVVCSVYFYLKRGKWHGKQLELGV
jgi:hypothetical protein